MSDMNKKFVVGTTYNGWIVTKVNEESVWLSFGNSAMKFKIWHYETSDAAIRNGSRMWAYKFN